MKEHEEPKPTENEIRRSILIQARETKDQQPLCWPDHPQYDKIVRELLADGLILGFPNTDPATVLGIREAGENWLRDTTPSGKARRLVKAIGRKFWLATGILIGSFLGSLGTLLAQWLFD